jgi:hypothetical protein
VGNCSSPAYDDECLELKSMLGVCTSFNQLTGMLEPLAQTSGGRYTENRYYTDIGASRFGSVLIFEKTGILLLLLFH